MSGAAEAGRRRRTARRAGDPRGRRPAGPFRARVAIFSAWLALAPATLAVAIYANTLHHDFVLDDEIAVRRNVLVQQGVKGIPAIFAHGYLFGFNRLDYFYRPLSLAGFALEVEFFGHDPHAHHAVNVALFAACAALLYLFLAALLAAAADPAAAPPRASPRMVALAAALLFAAHPIHTEVVASIKSRDEILCLLFVLLMLRLLVAHVVRGRPWMLAAALAAYALAALSKETGLAAFGLVPLTCWFLRPRATRRLAVTTAAFAVVAAALLLLHHAVARDGLPPDPASAIINNALAAAARPGWRFATSVAVLGRYLGLLLWPRTLSYDYSYDQVPLVGPRSGAFLAALVVHAALGVVAVRGLRRRHTLAYAILWYAILVAPVSNLVIPLGTVMGERLVFAASVGFCLALGWLLVEADRRFARGRLLTPALAVILGLYGARAITRNLDWRDPAHLYASGIRTAPRSARAWNHYASDLLGRATELPAVVPARRPLLEAAIAGYDRALAILPGYAEASYNRGVAHGVLGDTAAAEADYESALRADRTHEGALHNLAGLRFRQGRIVEARRMWLAVVAGDSLHDGACANIGATFVREGDERRRTGDLPSADAAYRSAVRWFLRARAIAPGNPDHARNLAITYARLGDPAEARRWLDQAGER